MFHSNWVVSSSLIVKNHRRALFSLSLPLSLSHSLAVSLCPLTFAYSLSTSPVSSLSCFHRISFGFFKIHFFLFSLPCLRLPSLSPLVQSDLSVGEWQQDGNSGNTSRVLSYTISLNNPLGPKTAPVVETQVSVRRTAASKDCSGGDVVTFSHWICSLYLHSVGFKE